MLKERTTVAKYWTEMPSEALIEAQGAGKAGGVSFKHIKMCVYFVCEFDTNTV